MALMQLASETASVLSREVDIGRTKPTWTCAHRSPRQKMRQLHAGRRLLQSGLTQYSEK